MNAVVMYESMYGNTRSVAEAIAEGLGAVAAPVGHATSELLAEADLLVVGAPTHVHGLSRPKTRAAAAQAAAKPTSGLTLEPEATSIGMREWLTTHVREVRAATAFDTRVAIAPMFSGRASRGIARILRHGGVNLVARPQSFLVTKENQLLPGELERARQWGEQLAGHAVRR